MTHSSSLLPLPQRGDIHTHTHRPFFPRWRFCTNCCTFISAKAEMQWGHFTPPQSLSALMRLLKHIEVRPSPAIWEFQKCTLIFHSSCIFFFKCQIQTIYALQKPITIAFMKVKSSKGKLVSSFSSLFQQFR